MNLKSKIVFTITCYLAIVLILAGLYCAYASTASNFVWVVDLIVTALCICALLVLLWYIWSRPLVNKSDSQDTQSQSNNTPERPIEIPLVYWGKTTKIIAVNNLTDKEYVYESDNDFGLNWEWVNEEVRRLLLIRKYRSYSNSDYDLIAVLISHSVKSNERDPKIIINQAEVDKRNAEIKAWDEKYAPLPLKLDIIFPVT